MTATTHDPATRHRPQTWRAARLGLLGAGLALVATGVLLPREDWLSQGAIALALAIAATGLGIGLGLGGEYLLGISFVVAAGAYPTAVLTVVFGWSYWPAALVGVLAGSATGMLLSLPGLRISQFYFGMVGFFLVFLVPNIVEMFATWTNGSNGMAIYEHPELFGIPLDEHGMFILAAVVLVAALLLSLHLRSSPLAVKMRQMRDAPHTLAARGTPVWRIRVATYLITSVLAGLSGAIYSHLTVFLHPNQFGFDMTTVILAAVIVGGSRSLLGPTIGLAILYIGPRLVFKIEGISDIVYGVVVLVSVLLFRGGVVQAVRDLIQALRRRRRPVAPGMVTPTSDADPAQVVEMLSALRPERADRVLRAHGVRKRFGAVQALDFADADAVEVRSGRVTLLLGPNGSGKTTLLNLLTGLLHADAGRVTLEDTDLTTTAAARIAGLGIRRSFQSPALPDELTCVDLLGAALADDRPVSTIAWLLGTPKAGRTVTETRDAARSLIAAMGFAAAADTPCAGLTSGQRRMVEVLLALVSPAQFVLLDEPAAGLSATERRTFAAVVRGLAERGVGFLVIEHDLELALALADHVVVMEGGRPADAGTPDEIQEGETLRRVLLGTGSR